MKSLLIIAGETSGDLQGSKLVKALKDRQPTLMIYGIGGDRMKDQGMELIFHMKQMAFLGFTEVVRHLPFIMKVMKRMLKIAEERQPDAAVLIDYPGFNLRFAKRAKKLGIKLIYYISPQIWAWHYSRIYEIRKRIDKMLVVFNFEKPIYEKVGMDVGFVGHPLLEGLEPKYNKKTFFEKSGLDDANKILALLPGSRVQEVESLLPPMIETVSLLRKKLPELQVLIGKAPALSNQMYTPLIMGMTNIHLIDNLIYDVMAHADAAIVSSGTATLETACFETPMAVVYKVSPLSYFIGKRLVKIKNIALANVVAGEEVVREFIQDEVDPLKLSSEVYRLLTDDPYRKLIKGKMKAIKSSLGEIGASGRAADEIINMIN